MTAFSSLLVFRTEAAQVTLLWDTPSTNANGTLLTDLAGFKIYCGDSSGAYNMIAPTPDGADAARTMALALEEAGARPEDVDYINAHGTSTAANDVAETQAIKRVFGARAPHIPISSTKSMIGHAIGAAGAIETVVCCLALEHQCIPPTINYREPDPACDLDYVPNTARAATLDVVLSNAFGFGSSNSCIALHKSV